MPQLMAGIAYVALGLDCIRRREWPIPKGPAMTSAAFLAFVWLLEVANPEQFNAKVVLLGLISYVYFIPLMFLGYAFIRNARDARRLGVFLALISILVTVVGMTQFVLGPARVEALVPGFRSFGQGTSNGLAAFRFPSTFAAVAQLQDFLTLGSVILLGACWDLAGWRRVLTVTGFAGLFFIGLINVSRTYYVTFPAGLIILLVLLWQSRAKRAGVRATAPRTPLSRRLLRLVLLVSFGAVAVLGAVHFAGNILAPRLATLSPDSPGFSTDIVSRFTKSAETLAGLVQTDYGWWHGHGTGTSTPYLFHLDMEAPIVEAFVPEVVYQTGVLGLLAYLFLYGSTFATCRWAIAKVRDRSVSVWACVFAAYLLLVVVESALGDEVLVLFPSAMFFWVILGSLMGLADGDRTGAMAPAP